MSARPICEYLDLEGTTLRLAVRFPGRDADPGEVVAARLVTRGGKVAARTSAELQIRVNSVGSTSRSQALLTFTGKGLRAGAYRLEILHDDTPAQVDPATGLLASSRPRPLGERTVQVFPGVRRTTWVRIGDTTRSGRVRWALANLGRDLAFAAHARRFTWVRLARTLTVPFVPRGDIWLVGERPETARDNGWAFFTYARTRAPAAPIYYVIARGAATNVAYAGNIVHHSSLRHRLLLLHARVLLNAYSIKHMLPATWHPGAYMKQAAWRIGAKRVYLKHGVHLSPTAVKRANGGYDLLCTVGERERDALAEGTGYREQLAITGLARYDHLTSRPGRSILFMPTWRRYLAPQLFGGQGPHVPFTGSTYEKFIEEFLTSPVLAEILDAHDLTLDFVPHYNLADYLRGREFGNGRIRTHDAVSADIPRLIRESALLCTDYSSVHFDAAHLGVPVVYVQVDRAEYHAGHSIFPWFDVDTDGFGPVATTVTAGLEHIARYARGDFTREGVYEERVGRIFTHRDHRNCERIYEEVTKLS